MSDIVERLLHPSLKNTHPDYHDEVVGRVADEIERLLLVEKAYYKLSSRILDILEESHDGDD